MSAATPHPVASDGDLPDLTPTPTGLYRHYKGGWYEVLDTVRCSETLQGMTLYRALYGEGLHNGGLWVRPAAMFGECGEFEGKTQPRFVRHKPEQVALADLITARAVIAHLRGLTQRQGVQLDIALRPPPPEPTTCCERGCEGCVWEGYFEALNLWRQEAVALLHR